MKTCRCGNVYDDSDGLGRPNRRTHCSERCRRDTSNEKRNEQRRAEREGKPKNFRGPNRPPLTVHNGLTQKACSLCNKVKPMTEYSVRWDGDLAFPRSECKSCRSAQQNIIYHANKDEIHRVEKARRASRTPEERLAWADKSRKYNRKWRYGLSTEAYDSLLESRGGVCAICKRDFAPEHLNVDHDHACCPGKVTCGKCVRALLCGVCNRAVGFYEKYGAQIAVYLEETTVNAST